MRFETLLLTSSGRAYSLAPLGKSQSFSFRSNRLLGLQSGRAITFVLMHSVFEGNRLSTQESKG